MLDSYLVGIGVTVSLAVLWAVVQTAWRTTFADVRLETDALAGRSGCGPGGCNDVCARQLPGENR